MPREAATWLNTGRINGVAKLHFSANAGNLALSVADHASSLGNRVWIPRSERKDLREFTEHSVKI